KGRSIGTPAYMSPEQVRGVRKVDGRSDLFSLGCVLFDALTGHAAFVGLDMLGVLTKILLEEPPRLRELCPAAPAALEALVARLLAKDPSARPASAREVAAELGAIARDLGGSGAPSVKTSLSATEQRMICVALARHPNEPHAAPASLDAEALQRAL